MEKKYYYKKNKKNNYKNNKVTMNNESSKKLTYDEIVNVRKDVSEINVVNYNNNFSLIKYVAISVIVLTIILGSLVLFRVI